MEKSYALQTTINSTQDQETLHWEHVLESHLLLGSVTM